MKNNLGKRIAMSAFGVMICAVSVGIFKIAALGVDPFQSFMAGLDSLIPIRFGTLYVITNAVLLLFALIFDRHYIGIATFINLFLLGYITQFTYDNVVVPLYGATQVGQRVVLLTVADTPHHAVGGNLFLAETTHLDGVVK